MENFLICTKQLTIRQLDQSDLPEFLLYRSNPEVTKYQGFDVMTEEQAAEFISTNSYNRFGKAGEWVQYAIARSKTNKLIGDCAIRLKMHDARIAEIGITISHLEQRKGYAKEAMMGILSFLFENHNIHRVEETVDAENTASVQLLESIGFRQEAHFVENIFFKGKWGSEYMFAMLKREWEKIK